MSDDETQPANLTLEHRILVQVRKVLANVEAYSIIMSS
jgi:hypothetical protein